MRQKFYLLGVFILLSLSVLAQYEVKFGDFTITPPQNIQQLKTAKSGLSFQTMVGDKHVVLLQLNRLLSPEERKNLAEKGIQLHDYFGGFAYLATIKQHDLASRVENSEIRSILPIKAVWKIDSRIINNEIPDFAKASGDKISIVASFNKTINVSNVKIEMSQMGLKISNLDKFFHTFEAEVSREQVFKIAEKPWISTVNIVAAPYELYDIPSRNALKVNQVARHIDKGDFSLSGKGVKIGILDGSIEEHIDYGRRAKVIEYPRAMHTSRGHGMHVAGIMAGAGTLDPKAVGIAPKATFYAYDFVESDLGHPVEKLLMTREENGATLTQNSYGVNLRQVCGMYEKLTYNYLDYDQNYDYMLAFYPSLLHIFSVGNDQGQCGGKMFKTSTKRMKNSLLVGAVDERDNMTSFSSWGPTDDGRIIPTVVAPGENIYSTMPKNAYDKKDGTSMATPMVTGVAALLTERYMQLNNNTEPSSAMIKATLANTANDLGNPGPDYKFGFGLVNAKNAIEAISKKMYFVDKIASGAQEKEFSISVPQNVEQLRVMIVWHDTVAKKQWTYGEAAIINKLGIEVTKDTETTLPWVLNPAKPNENAKRGTDELNNIQQVTIDNPAQGTYKAVVSARRVTTTLPQEFAVVYWFEQPTMELTFPLGGEIFEPGESFMAQWNKGKAESVALQISYDNGKTFNTIAQNITENKYLVKLPNDAIENDKTILRILANNHFSATQKPFTVMPTPTNLKAVESDCSQMKWAISWDKIAESGYTYDVLKANINEGFYEVVESDISSNTYEIPAEKISIGERNVFAVRAKNASGLLGQRTVGLPVNFSQTLTIQNAKLPFVERFNPYPSPFVKTVPGEEMGTNYLAVFEGTKLQPGEHLLSSFSPKRTPHKDWNDDDPFAVPARVGKIQICNIDLTSVTTGTKLLLNIEAIVGYLLKPTHSAMRVRINGNIVPDINGVSIHYETKSGELDFQVYSYDLSSFVGKNVSISIENAAYTGGNALVIKELKILEADEKIELELQKLVSTKSGANLSNYNDVYIEVVNKTPKNVQNTVAKVTINGNLLASEIIEQIKPYETKSFVFGKKADFSTSKPFGEKFEVEVEILHKNDQNLQNNKKNLSIENYGNVYPMAISTRNIILGFDLGVKPALTKEVDEKIIFTAANGANNNYPDFQRSLVKFVPKDPTKVIKVSFSKLNLENGKDFFEVYQAILPTDNDLDGIQPAKRLTGNYANGVELISQNQKGELALRFLSNYDKNNESWVATVEQVKKENIFTLTMPKIPDAHFETNKTAVKILVKNNTESVQNDVKVAIRRSDQDWTTETISSIAAGAEVEHTFAKQIDLEIEKIANIQAKIVTIDPDFSDNFKEMSVLNHIYCKDFLFNSKWGNYLKRIENLNDVAFDTKWGGVNLDYETDKIFTFYKKAKKALLVLTAYKPLKKDESIAVYVDWNNDGTFGDEASKETFVKAGATNGSQKTFNFEVEIPDGAIPGNRRLRVVIAPSNKIDACEVTNVPQGDAKDFTVNLIDQAYPSTNDLGISGIEVASGTGLSNSEPLSVTITNNGLEKFNAKSIEVSYTINNGAAVKETIAQEILPLQTFKYTFNTKLDLSEPNKYAIKAILPSDNNESNNEVSRVVYNVAIPATGNFFALDFKSAQTAHSSEMLDLGTLNNTNFGNGGSPVAYEMWVRFDDTKKSYQVLDSKGVTIQSSGENPNPLFPKNSLVVGMLNEMYFHSPANSIEGGRWHHILVSINFGYFSNAKNFQIFIDGHNQNAKLVNANREGLPMGTGEQTTKIGTRLNGMVKHIRIWKKHFYHFDKDKEKEKTENQKIFQGVQDNMYKILRDSEGNLPENLLAEFNLNEGKKVAVASGKFLGVLTTSRLNQIWKKPANLLAKTNFEKQFGKSVYSVSNTLTTKFEPGTAFATIKGKIVPEWQSTELKYNNTKIDENTVFDFSGTGNSITVEAGETVVLGKTFAAQTWSINAQEGPSNLCDITSLKFAQSSNNGLSSDVNADVSTQTIVVDLSGVSNIKSLTPTFAISTNATIKINGVTYTSGTIDLSQPVLVLVTAENKVDRKIYTLAAKNSQNITWGGASSIDKTYGDAAENVSASASSNLPVIYTSSNPNVATVENGKLYFVGVGTATINATQPGGGNFAAANPVSKTVNVARKPISVKTKAISVDFGKPIPKFKYDFNGLVDETHAANIPPRAYTITKSDGGTWNPQEEFLPVGTHTATPVSASAEAYGNYSITASNGEVVVKSANAFDVGFNVKFNGNFVNENCKLEVGSFTNNFTASATHTVKLVPGTYKYAVSVVGYAVVSGEVVVSTKNETVEIALKKQNILLSYKSDENGIIVGKTSQTVANGEDGAAVTATAKQGYKFAKWSDGRTDNPRIDKNVTKAVDVTASYEKIRVTVTYVAAQGGSISGDFTQTVDFGANTTPVTANADADYMFLQWSDGRRDNPRHDENVVKNTTYTALFTEALQLPYYQDFADENLPKQWISVALQHTNKFKILKGTQAFGINMGENAGNYIGAIGTENTNTVLATPKFALTNQIKNLFIKFKYKAFTYFTYAKLKFSYRTDISSGYIELPTLNTNQALHDYFAEVNPNNLKGAKFIQFKWELQAQPNTGYLVIDDIQISDNFALTYLAGAGGKVTGEAEQKVAPGKSGTAVTAVPNDGYQFVQWSDSVTDNPRTDQNVKADVTVTAEFKGLPQTLTIATVANGTIVATPSEGIVAGTEITLTATPSEGYRLKAGSLKAHKTGDEATAVAITEGKFAMPAFDVTVTAEFELIPRVLTIATVANGTIAAAPSEGIVAGMEITLTATPSEGYRLKAGSLKAYKTGDEATAVAITEGKFTMPAFDVTVTAEFEGLPQTVTFTVLGKNANAIKDATIAISEKTLTTNDKGVVSIDLIWGEYDYTVKKEGFIDYSNKIKVEKDSLKVAVNLIKVGITSEFAQIQVMPNPVSDKLILKGIEHITSIEIYSLTGKLNKKIEVSFLKRTTIDVSDFNSGVYIIKLSNQKGENHLLKIVKE